MSDERMPVATDLPDYRVAAAELPLSTRLTDTRRGAIVVVPGDGDWPAAVGDAAAAGARVVIVAEPGRLITGALAAEIPVLIERRLLPEALSGAVAHHTAPAHAIVIEAAAARADVRAVLGDAVGWARVLGGPVEPGDAASTDAFVLATGTAGGVPVAITVTVLAEAQASRLRATAIGTSTTEVVVDPFAGAEHVEMVTVDGRMRLPARLESSARAALRRALTVDSRCTDLDDLQADAAVAAAFLGA